MAFNISYNIQAFDKFTSPARKIARSVEQLDTKFDKLNRSMKRASQGMKELGQAMSLKVTAPLGLLGGFALKAAADLESLEVSFSTMVGSAEKAQDVIKSLTTFTARTPFQLEGVAKAARQLLAAGVSVENMESKLKFLGDISAGANVPLSDMAAIFAKVKNKGKAMTEEILQMSDRGIPIIDALAKEFGVTKNQVFDLAQKGKISFDVIEKSLRKMSEKGGIFFDLMAKKSGTLGGLFSTLKDNVFLASSELGKSIVTVFDLKTKMSSLIATIHRATESFKSMSPAMQKTIILGGFIISTIGPLLVGLGLLIKSLAFAKTAVVVLFAPLKLMGMLLLTTAGRAKIAAIAMSLYGKATKIAGFAMAAFNLFMKANPIVRVISLILTAVGALAAFAQEVKSFLSLPIAKLFGDKAEIEQTVKTNGVAVDSAQAGQQSQFNGTLNINGAPQGSTLRTQTNEPNFNVGLNLAPVGG